ncbi:hypothetical protein HanIR_Chr12g0593281 [Helianthus annuus]|nr:hypothetical protein HanIR_Chr12g0593281 [Helianthus annuus]
MFGIRVRFSEVEAMAGAFGCKAGKLPFIHLGLPVGGNTNLIRSWEPVVEKIRNRLSIWKARQLSVGDRITLLKSILNALPTDYFSLFRTPVRVIKTLERLRRSFFSGGSEDVDKMSWMTWSNISIPVDKGRMGFGSLRDTNIALLSKWWWRFKTEQ